MNVSKNVVFRHHMVEGEMPEYKDVQVTMESTGKHAADLEVCVNGDSIIELSVRLPAADIYDDDAIDELEEDNDWDDEDAVEVSDDEEEEVLAASDFVDDTIDIRLSQPTIAYLTHHEQYRAFLCFAVSDSYSSEIILVDLSRPEAKYYVHVFEDISGDVFIYPGDNFLVTVHGTCVDDSVGAVDKLECFTVNRHNMRGAYLEQSTDISGVFNGGAPKGVFIHEGKLVLSDTDTGRVAWVSADEASGDSTLTYPLHFVGSNGPYAIRPPKDHSGTHSDLTQDFVVFLEVGGDLWCTTTGTAFGVCFEDFMDIDDAMVHHGDPLGRVLTDISYFERIVPNQGSLMYTLFTNNEGEDGGAKAVLNVSKLEITTE